MNSIQKCVSGCLIIHTFKKERLLISIELHKTDFVIFRFGFVMKWNYLFRVIVILLSSVSYSMTCTHPLTQTNELITVLMVMNIVECKSISPNANGISIESFYGFVFLDTNKIPNYTPVQTASIEFYSAWLILVNAKNRTKTYATTQLDTQIDNVNRAV